jgi:hypothetical protein
MVLARRRVFLYQHFLSDDEANHLISLVSAALPPPIPHTQRLSLLLGYAWARLNFPDLLVFISSGESRAQEVGGR